MMSRIRRALSLVVLAGLIWAGPVLAADTSSSTAPAPAGLAVDSEGNVYVSDYALDRMVKFGPDGSVLGQWGGTGNALGQFNAPFGVAIDANNTLFVVDQLNNRVQRFATDGTPLSAWGGAGAGAGDLRTPFGVTVGGGRVYVADFGNDRVQVFGSDGSLLWMLGGHGSGDGQFERPAGVAMGPDGALYVTDHFNDRVQRFSGDGHFLTQFGAASSAFSPGSSGGPPTPTSSPTTVPNPGGTATPVAPGSSGNGSDGQLRRPEGIVVDRDGDVWVADYGHDRVVKLTADGHFLLSWGNRGSAPGEFLGPKGIAIDPTSGRIYVADTGNARVQRLAPDGTPEAAWAMPALPNQ